VCRGRQVGGGGGGFKRTRFVGEAALSTACQVVVVRG
jgi:hypothetical protein